MSLFYNNRDHIILQQHVWVALILMRCIVREIRLIIMIRVEVLSTENSHFTRAFSRPWKVGTFRGA